MREAEAAYHSSLQLVRLRDRLKANPEGDEENRDMDLHPGGLRNYEGLAEPHIVKARERPGWRPRVPLAGGIHECVDWIEAK